MSDARAALGAIFRAALEAADPYDATRRHLPEPRPEMIVIAAGKASARMALAAERTYGTPLRGIVVTRHGHGEPALGLPCIEAEHPVPDVHGLNAARRVRDLARSAKEDAFMLVLLSGGASALLALPADGISLADKQEVSRALLRAGADITEINCVRKHLSALKGGRLAAAAFPATTRALLVSDVPGDDPSVIASGPTTGDPTTRTQAKAILETYKIAVPESVRRTLEDPASETPKPGDPRLARSSAVVILRPRDMVGAAADRARDLGYETLVLGDDLSGEAGETGAAHAHLAKEMADGGRRIALISGGELSVHGASGREPGGRCREYALALAAALGGDPRVCAFAADSDGIDGTDDAAGAYVLPKDLARAKAMGLDPGAMLVEHRSGGYFSALGSAIVTGPTRTNLADLRVILADAHGQFH